MKGYKGFKKGLICNPNGKPKQYAENTVFEEDSAVICHSGMHFCENPFDVLDYYPLIDDNGEFIEVAEVEALDDVKTDDNKKYCTKKLKIGAKLEFSAFIKAAISFIFEKTDYSEQTKTASGDYSQLAASGYSSKLAASGYYSQLAASGYYSKLAASGDYSQLAASGDYSQLAASGYYSVIAGIGIDNIAKGKKGSWITLAEWKFDENKDCYIPVCVKTRKIDGRRIKEDTFYKLVDGKFTEV